VEDDHVDRPGVEAPQGVELTGTNSSIGLIALINAMLILAFRRQVRAAIRAGLVTKVGHRRSSLRLQRPVYAAACAQVGRGNRLKTRPVCLTLLPTW
jgi:hypothetical protein